MLKQLCTIENRIERLFFLGVEFKRDTFNHIYSVFSRICDKLGKGKAYFNHCDSQKLEIEFEFRGTTCTASIDDQLNYVIQGNTGQIRTKYDTEQVELLLSVYLK